MKKPRKLHIVENQPELPMMPPVEPASLTPTPVPVTGDEKKDRLYLHKYIGPVITAETCRYIYKYTFNNKWTGKPMFMYERLDIPQ
jgi:hypothetical protein